MADAVTGLLDDYHGCRTQHLARYVQHRGKAVKHVLGPCIAQAKHDNGKRCVVRHGDDFAEIQVKGQHDAMFTHGLGKDIPIYESFQTLFTEVDGVLPLLAQPSNHARADPHVCEKAQVILQRQWTSSCASHAA